MTRFRRILCIAPWILTACENVDPLAVQHHIENLCGQEEVRTEYLDFYWDDLRTNQPEIWTQALGTCNETCPDAVNCGPVLSVASWYQQTPLATRPPNPRSPQ